MERFVVGLVEKGLSKHSIRLVLAALSVVLNSAIEKGLIERNLATGITKLYRQAPVRHEEIQPLTASEIPEFLRSVMKLCPEYYPLFLCALHAGMRSGELAGLQWGDVDFKGRFLLVRRSFVRGRVVPTKTGKKRRVDLSDSLADTLIRLKRKRREEWLRKGESEIPEWIFCNEAGNPLDMYNLKRRHFKRCLGKASLRKIRFHDLRHSYASLLIQDGQPLAYVREQLGHSSIRMTVDVYGHLEPGANREAVNRLPDVRSDQQKSDLLAAQG